MRIRTTHKVVLIAYFLAIALPTLADWSTDSAANDITVIHTSDNRYLHAISDDAGGMYVAWRDDRNSGTSGYDIYMQHLNGNGGEEWASGGIAICDEDSAQTWPFLVKDGSGGAIIFWIDNRAGPSDADIYAQRVNSSGTKQWTSSGLPIATGSGNQSYYYSYYRFEAFFLESSGGGAFIAYNNDADGDMDIYVQKINNSGTKQWGSSGTKVTNNANPDQAQRIVTDGSGGLIVAWENLGAAGANYIYAQRVNSSGVVQWSPADGIDVVPTPAWPSKPADPEMVADGSGGAIILFNTRAGLSTGNLYMQRINSSGALQWGNSGAILCNAGATEIHYIIEPDGIGNFYVAWADQRDLGTTGCDIYAQLIDVDGNEQWTPNGLMVNNAANWQYEPDMLVDGDGNLILAWRDDSDVSGSTGRNIMGQKLDSSGSFLWSSEGKAISKATGHQYMPKLIPTTPSSSEGYLVVWSDYRNGNYDIFGSFLNIDGSLGGPGVSPLPVEWLSFNGKANPNNIGLSWSTIWELNNDFYTVERSRDGINYEVIGYVQGKGEGEFNGRSDYMFTDQMPYFGVNYYRLKQVDFDGQFEYSNVIMVNFGREALISVYPNPTKENLRFLSEEVVKAVDIYSITGVKVLSKSFSQGVEPEVGVKELKPGKYIVQFSTDSNLYTRHFVKH